MKLITFHCENCKSDFTAMEKTPGMKGVVEVHYVYNETGGVNIEQRFHCLAMECPHCKQMTVKKEV